ncbi:DUF2971 domain-containing protein [Roseibium sp. MB-4]
MSSPNSELPAKLYKYSSPESVLKVLESSKVMFSSPSLFNDDFDMKLNLVFEVDEKQVLLETTERIWGMFNDPNYTFPDNEIAQALSELKPILSGSRGRFFEFMTAGVQKNMQNMAERFSQFSLEMAEHIDRSTQVFCMSSSGNIAPMWGLYADNIQGAVLCYSTSSVESMFRNAFPVKYIATPPSPLNNYRAVEWLSGTKALYEFIDPKTFLLHKHSDWHFEREWRLVRENISDTKRELVAFDPTTLHSVIVGIRSGTEFVSEVKRILDEQYPDTKLQKLQRSKYGLQYEIVNL